MGDPYELLAEDPDEKDDDDEGLEYEDPEDEDEDPEHFLHQYTGLQTGTHFSLATVLH